MSLVDVIPYIGTDRKRIEEILLSYGIQSKMSAYLAKSLEEDWRISEDIPYEQKIWALQRGFLPGRIKIYGLTESNYQDYLSDLDYALLHPLNNHFAIWINDKLTLKYVIPSVFCTLEGRKLSIMPDYYLYIENDGTYSYLMDAPRQIAHDENFLLNLLKEKSILALKPSRGQGGYGFVVLEYTEGKIFVNGRNMDNNGFNEFKKNLDGYIVTEYVKQHKALDAIWHDSVCTLRVVALKNRNKYLGGKLDVIVAYARFGTAASSGASNLSSRGVGISYDFNTGRFGSEFYRYLKFSTDGEFKFPYHPDSKVSLDGKLLPHWDIARDVIGSICDYLSSLEYFGFDLMVTDEGVKMCEINTFPDLCDGQVLCGPVFQNPSARTFFESKMEAKLHSK